MALAALPRAQMIEPLSAAAFADWATAGSALTRAWAARRAVALLRDGVSADALDALVLALARLTAQPVDLAEAKRVLADAASTHMRVAAMWALELQPFIDDAVALRATSEHVTAVRNKLALVMRLREEASDVG